MTSKIPYYTVRERHGRRLGYWQPTQRMKAAGFKLVPCGDDGADARAVAEAWNERWRQHKQGRVSSTNSRPAKDGYVYFLKVGDRIKIGFSTKPQDRVAELSTAIFDPIDLLMVVRGSSTDERKLHHRLAAYRQRGEWFVAAPEVMRVAIRSLMFGRPMHSETGQAAEQNEPETLTA